MPPERLQDVWPYVAPALTAAVARCGDWTIEALRTEVFAGRMLLWILWNGDDVEAAAISQLSIVPRGKVCTVIACGGRAESWTAALGPIERYASEAGCVATRIHGRAGWAKVFDDYDLEWIALEKRLG